MNAEMCDAIGQLMDLTPAVANLCKPLFAASPIAVYSYHEYHKDGSIVRVCSDKKVVEKAVERGVDEATRSFGKTPLVNMMRYTKDHRKAGFHLWDLDSRPKAGGMDVAPMGFGHACSFLEKASDDVVRVHYFVGRYEDETVNDFHLNNTNMLGYFCRYISKELQPAIRKTRPLRLFPDQHETYAHWMDAIGGSSQISIPKFLIGQAPHVNLSKRQKELLYWTIMGKTTEEIAGILDLNKSTIKRYFERLQIKFQCRSKHEIVAELLKNGFCFADLQENKAA